MARYAQVETASGLGYVTTIIELQSLDQYIPPAGHQMVEDTVPNANTGYTWDGTNFIPPPLGEYGPGTLTGFYAMVETTNGYVALIVEHDLGGGEYIPPAGHVMIHDPERAAQAGYTWDGTNFIRYPIGEFVPPEAEQQ